MNYDEFKKFCGSLPATTYIVQWGKSVVKFLLSAAGGINKQPAFVFKTSDLNFGFLTESEGYKPPPYFANRGMKWIQQFHNVKENDDDLIYYLTESQRLVALGLTKAKKSELGLNHS